MHYIVPFLILFFLSNVLDYLSTILSLSVGNVEMNPIFYMLGENIIYFGIFKLFFALIFCIIFYDTEESIFDRYVLEMKEPRTEDSIRSIRYLFISHVVLYFVVVLLTIMFTYLAFHNVSISVPYL